MLIYIAIIHSNIIITIINIAEKLQGRFTRISKILFLFQLLNNDTILLFHIAFIFVFQSVLQTFLLVPAVVKMKIVVTVRIQKGIVQVVYRDTRVINVN